MERLAAAVEAWQADPGIPGQLTSRQIDLPGKAAIAERDLKDYEAELVVIKLLRAELRLRAAEAALTPCEQREPATATRTLGGRTSWTPAEAARHARS